MGNTPKSLQGVIETRFVTELQKESGFILEPDKPETIIRFTITNFFMRTDSSRKGSGNNSYTEYVTTGALDVSFQALDADSGVAWYSENLSTPYRHVSCSDGGSSFTQGRLPGALGGILGGCSIPKDNSPAVNNENELMILLVNNVVKQMAKSVTQTTAEIPTPLPGGKLKDLSDLAKRGEFGTMAERLQTLPAFPKPEDDAFRFYMLGVAKEAQAYAAGDPDSTHQLLTKAVLDYEKAVAMRSDDQRMRDAELRVRQAIRQRDAIVKQQEDFARAVKQKEEEQKRAAEAKKQSIAEGQKRAVTVKPGTNEEIIEALKAGLDENTILTGLIESNADPHYNVNTLAGLKQLKDAKVPAKLISAMQARMKTVSRPQAPEEQERAREPETPKPPRRVTPRPKQAVPVKPVAAPVK
jgi:hypothetical protein